MYMVYEVKLGDTLDSIASMFNMTMQEIKDLNGINELVVGMPIVVSKQNNWYKIYKVKSGDTLYNIANDNNISLNTLVAINGLDKDTFIYPEQEIIIPKDNYNIYVTKKGDNIIDVLKAMNISFSNLAIQNPKIILMEDQLLINKV